MSFLTRNPYVYMYVYTKDLRRLVSNRGLAQEQVTDTRKKVSTRIFLLEDGAGNRLFSVHAFDIWLQNKIPRFFIEFETQNRVI